MTETILITGGTGFVGSHLAADHIASGDDVHVLVRPGGPSRRRHIPMRRVTVHRVRLDDRNAVAACIDEIRPTVIYHLASGTGRDPAVPAASAMPQLLQDVVNLLVLLSAASETRVPPRVLIRAGSLAEYGNGATPASEDQREEPLTVYTAAMVAGVHYSRMLQPRLPFPVVTARFALVYGPGQDENYLVPWLLERCLAGQSSEISSPNSRRDMIFIDDLVDGLRRMASARLPGGTILNLSTGIAPTVREIAALVVSVCGADPTLLRFRDGVATGARVASLQGSPARARALLGWEARTPLKDGLGLCVGAPIVRGLSA